MSRKSGQRDPASFINLDSFMDILTNVIGALFFIIVYAVLSASLAKSRAVMTLTSLRMESISQPEATTTALPSVYMEPSTKPNLTAIPPGSLAPQTGAPTPLTTTPLASAGLVPGTRSEATTTLLALGRSKPGAKGKTASPLLTLGDTEGVVFECRSSTILFPDIEAFEKAALDIVEKAKAQGVTDGYSLATRLNEANIHTPFYSLSVLMGIAVVLTPVSGSFGENGFQLQHEDSVFRRALARFNPRKQHIFFLVRSDSFEVFHTARKLVMEQGFHVGWEPLDGDSPLLFGAGEGVIDVRSHF